ncbi:hypothetical protein N7495_005937 [Penicillium taxi]|uniref:uncharacterized protein n=1 Tax=Penicillium taxi TaxID=168475 RepID=UPI0025453F02|nr:uncharacterized protein N7495_005937 [Penicillium taxi]KAJ5894246.1 hypothetical protein N7495_005937 [Penicillium taxi]
MNSDGDTSNRTPGEDENVARGGGVEYTVEYFEQLGNRAPRATRVQWMAEHEPRRSRHLPLRINWDTAVVLPPTSRNTFDLGTMSDDTRSSPAEPAWYSPRPISRVRPFTWRNTLPERTTPSACSGSMFASVESFLDERYVGLRYRREIAQPPGYESAPFLIYEDTPENLNLHLAESGDNATGIENLAQTRTPGIIGDVDFDAANLAEEQVSPRESVSLRQTQAESRRLNARFEDFYQ